MGQSGLWTRIGSWLRTGPSRAGLTGSTTGRDGDGALAPTDELGGTAEVTERGALSRWSRRDQTLQKLQEGFERLSEVLDGVRTHLDAHAERSKAMTAAMQQLVELTRQLPQQSAEQSATLERIATAIAKSAERDERIAASLADLPVMQKRQIETVSAIGAQLESARETDARVAGAVERVGLSVDRWSSAVDEQSESMKALQTAMQRNDDQIRSLIARQHRTWTWLLVIVLGVAAGALAVGIVAMVIE